MFVKAIVAAVVAIPFVAQNAFAATCTRTYTVQAGDWCDTISAAHNVSTYQLAVVNIDTIDTSCSNLQIGQSLCLGTQGSDCTQTYVVKSQDSCQAIATNHVVNSTIFNLNNPQLNADCDNLYIGEVVCVATTAVVPTLPSGSPMPASTIPPGVPAAQTLAPSPSSSHVATTSPTPAPTAAADDGDVDDEDLPWCDE